MRIRITVEYDGAAFSGWQEQAEVLTVQGELQRALAVYAASLAKKTGVENAGDFVVVGSGRTDAGVHARCQSAHFDWPDALALDAGELFRSLNGISHPALAIVSAEEVSADFHARHSPHVKQYQYRMMMRANHHGVEGDRAWYIPSGLDIPRMIEAARQFRGTHDFSAFRASDCSAPSTERTILLSEVARVGRDELRYIVEGKGFLKQMVRIIVGTLVDVGRGRIAPDDISGIIASGDRSRAGQTAPAQGLVLQQVRYL